MPLWCGGIYGGELAEQKWVLWVLVCSETLKKCRSSVQILKYVKMILESLHILFFYIFEYIYCSVVALFICNSWSIVFCQLNVLQLPFLAVERSPPPYGV